MSSPPRLPAIWIVDDSALDAERPRKALADLLEAIPDAILVVDERGMASYSNPAARRILPVDDLLGRPLWQILPELSQAVLGNTTDPPLPDVRTGNRLYSPTARRLIWK